MAAGTDAGARARSARRASVWPGSRGVAPPGSRAASSSASRSPGVLAPRPGVLVLDEPTAHLDPSGTEALFGILAGLRERRAATIVLIEHRAELAWPLADVVLALDDDGRPIDVGPPAAVLKRSAKRMTNAGIWLPEATAKPASAKRTVPNDRALGTLPVLEMRGVRFGYDRENTVLRDVDLTVDPRGTRRPRRGERQRQEHAPARSRSGSVDRRPGSSGSASEIPLGCRRSSSPASRATSSRIRSSGSSATRCARRWSSGSSPSRSRYAHALCDHLRLPLETFGDRSPYRLSGGEQRRLSLVTGLARRPLLLALDEPTFGQDRRGHEALISALEQLVEDGSALLAATHDERFVRDATDRRIELAAGWIVEDAAEDGAAATGEASPG